MNKKATEVLCRSSVQTLVILLPFVFPVMSAGQDSSDSRTVWDGVYAGGQAARGEARYEAACSGCHGADLSGGRATGLKGEIFMERWREVDLEPLFTFIRNEMPRNAEVRESMTEEDYLDIFSYMLQENTFPAGSSDLTVEDLASIMLVGPDGPRPVPDGSMVLVVGCLERLSETSWGLTHATEPSRNRTPMETTPEELTVSEGRSLGPYTFRLQDIEYVPDFVPEPHLNRKMQAKGLLVRQPNAERIQVTSLEPVGDVCEP